jgi:hypothetical protein
MRNRYSKKTSAKSKAMEQGPKANTIFPSRKFSIIVCGSSAGSRKIFVWI